LNNLDGRQPGHAAAARSTNPDGTATNQDEVNMLVAGADAGAARGSTLMSAAVADGSFIGTPG
jgi:hypothetical protein